jgi:hypothetical protein
LILRRVRTDEKTGEGAEQFLDATIYRVGLICGNKAPADAALIANDG